MSIPIPPANNSDDFSGNMLRPFQLESSSLRGRIVRFNTVLDDILIPHDYPKIVSKLLAEVVTLCSLLSSMLKFDGVFTLQTSGDGPVSMLVADMTSDGGIRGCANYDEARLNDLKDHDFRSLVGTGYIAFTVDQGENTERYQGIVELSGETLVETVEHYFSQSEQVKTNIMLAAERSDAGGDPKWNSRGLIIQQMPEDGGHALDNDMSDNVVPMKGDDWDRASILMDSCTRQELLDENLNAHDILLRLFHEEGVRVFPPLGLRHQCRCSDEKVRGIYKMLSEEERAEIEEEGIMEMTCEFCSKKYTFKVEDLK